MKYIITQEQIDFICLFLSPVGEPHDLLRSLKPLQPMTDAQIWSANIDCSLGGGLDADKLVKAIEKHHGIGE